MTTAQLLLLASAIGHGVITVFVLNVSHGAGFNVRWADRIVLASLALVGLAALAVGWPLWARPWAEWPVAVQAYSVLCLAAAGLGLPAATIARAMRRPLRGVNCMGEEREDLVESLGLDSLIGPGGRAFFLKIPWNDAFRLSISDWSVELDDLPEAQDGLTILHLSDLHFAPSYSRAFFEAVIDRALAGAPQPDLVLVTGDFLDDDAMNEWVVPVLSRLRGRLGQFAVLGNHDYRHDFRTLRRRLRDAGFRTLEGRWAVIRDGGTRIAIGGTTHPWGLDVFRREVPSAELTLLMSHSPDEIYRAAERGINMVFSGHNHGGQVRLPVIGPVLMPSRYSRRLDRGFFRVNRTLLHVSQGVGAKDPLRIGCPPEATRLVLRVRGWVAADGVAGLESLASAGRE